MMLRLRGAAGASSSMRKAAPPHACARVQVVRAPRASRRRLACYAFRGDTAITAGQKLRGHGPGGWKEAGWDVSSPDKLGAGLRQMMVNYGQLTQVTYDHLGTDPSKSTWGYTTVPPRQLIDYLTQDYPLTPGLPLSTDTPKGTADIYRLPQSDTLSPLIYALPGNVVDPSKRDDKRDEKFDEVFSKLTAIPTELIGGTMGLYKPDPKTGRGLVARPSFMGYVAVSQPSGPDREVDAVFVWRGTIFKEEWAENFEHDKLVKWAPPACDDPDVAQPWDIAVHRGFSNLYLLKAGQPEPKDSSVPALPGSKMLPPREVVHRWLVELMREHNVTTVTTTGHSLGGALSTLCAFDIGQELERLWADDKAARAARAGWKTAAKPKVTAIAFAPPRVGNYTFLREFDDKLQIKELRICNVGDVVPKSPGLWVQYLTNKLWKQRGMNVYADMQSAPARAFALMYYAATWVSAKLGFPSRWSYFHVDTILEVDSDKDLGTVGKANGVGGKHNLEGYIYMLSRKGTADGQTDRNPLLLNKSDDILANHDVPMNWWAHAAQMDFSLVKGRWQHLKA